KISSEVSSKELVSLSDSSNSSDLLSTQLGKLGKEGLEVNSKELGSSSDPSDSVSTK
ncbi:10991_t:CDS:2, partial [Scutellospora calospora]